MRIKALIPILSIALPTMSAQATVVVFSDNFNSANGGSVSAGINDAGRQSGTLAPLGYSEAGSHSIASNQLSTGTSTSVFATLADFTTTLTDPSITGFTLSFDAANSGNQWISPYLSTHPGDERDKSQIGLRITNSGTVFAHGTANGANTDSRSDAQLDALLGSFNVAAMNSYSLVATTLSTTSGTYDVFINGTEVMSDIGYLIGSGGDDGEINWEEIHPGISNAPTFDNLLLTTVPEPSAFALVSLSIFSLVFTRRRRRQA